jgi:hypothetical protein
LNAVGLTLLTFLLYGVWEVGRGVLGGGAIVDTLKYFIFNYYPLFLYLGLWVALQAPDFLPRLMYALAWVHGIYGMLWLLALRYVDVFIPGTNAKIFGWPGGGEIAILGLLCFGYQARGLWPVLILNIMVTLAMQVRAQWLGLALGMLVWGVLRGRLGRVIAIGMAGLAVLAMIELAGVELAGRTSAVSLGEIVGRAIAPIDAELATKFAPDARTHAGTAEWRQKWWEQIWLSVHSKPILQAFGHGYGFDLFGLAPEDVRQGQVDGPEIRTPHSVFYYALGYTGWIGVALFAAFQFAILRLLWRAFQVGGQPAGVAFWVMNMAAACFEQSFDTPYKAIPFYLLAGMTMAPALQSEGERDARTARAQLLSVAGRGRPNFRGHRESA